MKQDKRAVRILCLLGIVPVVWLGLLIAPAASGGAHPVQFACECHLPPAVVSDHARTPMPYAPAACAVIVATTAFHPLPSSISW